MAPQPLAFRPESHRNAASCRSPPEARITPTRCVYENAACRCDSQICTFRAKHTGTLRSAIAAYHYVSRTADPGPYGQLPHDGSCGARPSAEYYCQACRCVSCRLCQDSGSFWRFPATLRCGIWALRRGDRISRGLTRLRFRSSPSVFLDFLIVSTKARWPSGPNNTLPTIRHIMRQLPIMGPGIGRARIILVCCDRQSQRAGGFRAERTRPAV